MHTSHVDVIEASHQNWASSLISANLTLPINSFLKLTTIFVVWHSADNLYKQFGPRSGLTECWPLIWNYVIWHSDGIFSCFCRRLLTFFKINFFKIFFQKHYQSVKWFGSISESLLYRSWSGSKLVAKVISR